jgi:hypothetical protein
VGNDAAAHPNPQPPRRPETRRRRRRRSPAQFCPTNTALEAFARISGYRTGFADLIADAKARPAAWRAYLDRLLSYHFAPEYMPADKLLGRAGPIPTGLVTSRDAAGKPAESATLTAAVAAQKVSLLAAGSKVRVPVIGSNLYLTKGAAVHAVGKVLMPPDTYATLAAALKADKRLLTTTRYAGLNLRSVAAKAGTWATVRGGRRARGRAPGLTWGRRGGGGERRPRGGARRSRPSDACRAAPRPRPRADGRAHGGGVEVARRRQGQARPRLGRQHHGGRHGEGQGAQGLAARVFHDSAVGRGLQRHGHVGRDGGDLEARGRCAAGRRRRRGAAAAAGRWAGGGARRRRRAESARGRAGARPAPQDAGRGSVPTPAASPGAAAPFHIAPLHPQAAALLRCPPT